VREERREKKGGKGKDREERRRGQDRKMREGGRERNPEEEDPLCNVL
jgi:hypothetical protein